MYYVKALKKAVAKDISGNEVDWNVGDVKLIADADFEKLNDYTDAFKILDNINPLGAGNPTGIARAIVFGDSMAAQQQQVRWLRTLLAGSVRFVKFAGVGGNRLVDFLNRLDADVINVDAELVLFYGLTNNLLDSNTLEQIKPQFDEMVNRILNSGKQLWIATPPPVTSGTFTATQNANAAKIKRYLQELSFTKKGVFFVDTHQVLVDQTSSNAAALATLMTDTVHYNSRGGRRVANRQHEAMKTLYPTYTILGDNSETISATNPTGSVLTSVTRAGATGTNQSGAATTGSVSTGILHLATGGASSVASKVARTDLPNGEWQELVQSWSANGEVYYYANSIVGLEAFVNMATHSFRAEIETQVLTVTGNVSVVLEVTFRNSAGTDIGTFSTTYENIEPINGILVLEVPIIPSNASRLVFTYKTVSVAGGAITHRVGTMLPRFVPN